MVHRLLAHVLPSWVLQREELHLAVFLHPVYKWVRGLLAVLGLRTARIVETKHSELRSLKRKLEDLVLGNILCKVASLLLGHTLDFCPQILINLDRAALLRGPGRLGDLLGVWVLHCEQRDTLGLEARPALLGPRACAWNHFEMQPLADQHQFLNDRARGEPVVALLRLHVLALPDDDPTLFGTADNFPEWAHRCGLAPGPGAGKRRPRGRGLGPPEP
mmetsp:Transcript_39933/g.114095  ORF Transcript_39933/g.114095 Transcript_39933/m.114095 type:complete len:218 (-) Transcript_39933:3-656(-)